VKLTSELRDATYQMGSHSVICYPTEVAAPGRLVLDLLTPYKDERLSGLVGWLHTEMVYPSTDGHPSEY